MYMTLEDERNQLLVQLKFDDEGIVLDVFKTDCEDGRIIATDCMMYQDIPLETATKIREGLTNE